jgi:hypothetical protein
MFEAVAHGASGPLADVLLLRQQVRDQWKWIVSTESLGTSSVKSTLKVMHEGSTVASATGAAGASLGEISEFPSRLAIATTRSATTVTWGFAKPVEVRVAGRTGTLGSLQKANEVSVTFPVGAPKGLSSIELKRRGVGRLSWPSAKTTLIAPAAKAP